MPASSLKFPAWETHCKDNKRGLCTVLFRVLGGATVFQGMAVNYDQQRENSTHQKIPRTKAFYEIKKPHKQGD